MVHAVSHPIRTRAAKASPSRLSQEAERALGLLSREGAYGLEGEKADIVVVGPRNGVSVRVGSFRKSVLTLLLALGLVLWEAAGRSGRRRLQATAEGRAHAARQGAPEWIDPWLAQHNPLRRAQADEAQVLVDEAESPLAWLARRKGKDGLPLVDAACLEAGERLRRDLTIGAMLPRTTANWSAAVASGARAQGPTDFTDTMIAARQRARAALSAVGPDLSGLLIDICGFLKGLETIERERGWPARSGKLVLELALRQLCRHYGLQSEARGRATAGLRHWGVGDFRPVLHGAAQMGA